jgi:adenylate cyclase
MESPVNSADIGPDAIRDQLERVLASEAFANAGRHRRLLEYVVSRTLANEGSQLKEYVVATEVFERPDTYDPRLDTIVRVEMRRLRARLESYYRGPGVADPILITIPRGSYVPDFSRRAASPLPDEPEPPTTPHGYRRPVVWAGVASLVLLSVLLAAWHLRPDGAPSAIASTRPGVAVLPFESYSLAPADRLLAERLTDAVTTELAKLDTVSVASRTSTSRYARGHRSLHEIAEALGVQFVVEASALLDADRLRVVVRLVDAERDRKVWVTEYALTESEILAVAPRIASHAAAGLVAYRAARTAAQP